jgi:NAD(P) transhydrogenase subunit alpha
VRPAEAGDVITIMLGAFAVFLGTINVVGGFAVTSRMLEKFKKEKVLELCQTVLTFYGKE